MKANARYITAADALHYMAPATLVSFIADLDQHTAVFEDATTDALLEMAIVALFANVGASDGIDMLAEAEVSAENPQIAWTIDEWLKIDAEPTEEDEDEAAAIEKARRGEPMTQIWQDRTSFEYKQF